MIQFLLDTNICIALIRGRSPLVVQKVRTYPVRALAISTITLAELRCGISKANDPLKELTLLTRVLAPFEILPFDERATIAYGPLRAFLESTGQSIGPLDTLIAAHALSLKLPLVTNNEKEFRRVPSLVVENWTKP